MLNALKKWLPLILLIAGVISLAVAIILFAVVIPKGEGYKKVLGTICAILLLILTLLIAWYLFLTRDTDPNFFLFDRAKKRNIALNDLTFTIVNERMGFFLTMLLDKEGPEALWQNDMLRMERKFGPKNVYRPLVAYKMLYDLVDLDISSRWNLLFEATPAAIDSICSALTQAGETDFVKAFRYLMENCKGDEPKIRDFLERNTRFLRGRMVAYVKEHIELFY